MIEKGKKFQAAVINADQLLESQARGIGDSMMTETKEDRSGSKIKKFFTRMWKHNLASEYYRQKEIDKARKDIIESGDLYIGEREFEQEAASSQHHKDAMNAIVERFTSEYEKEMIHKGETKEKGSQAVNHDIKELIKSYVNANAGGKGGMSEADFKEEKNRILKGHNPEYAKEKSLYADNLLDIAKEVQDAVEHGQKLDEMDFDVDMTFGHAREGINTEARKTTLDRLLGDSGIGKSILQSAIMTTAVVGTYSVVKALAEKSGRGGAKLFGFAGGVVAGGVIAGFKENSRLNRERAQHMRESAKGMKFEEPDMERRQQMEKYRLETRNATEIIQTLEADLASARAGNLPEAERQGIMARLAEVEARIQTGDRHSVDLIAYDHFGSVEKDRMQIDLKRAELKVALRKSGGQDGTYMDPTYTDAQNFDELLKHLTNEEANASLEKDIAEKNRQFKWMKAGRIAKKVGQAILVGGTLTAAVSLVSDEVESYFNSTKDGVFEGAFKNNADLNENASLLEGARRWIFQDGPRMPMDDMHEIPIDGTQMHLPEGVEMVQNSDGTFDVTRNGEIISDNVPLTFDDSGNLSAESRDLLAKDDIYTDFSQEGGKVTETVVTHPKDWVDKNLDNLHRIERTHLGNDTEMYGRDANGQWILHKDPITGRMTSGADLNELRTHWTNGTGFDDKGFYSMNVQHMTDDGSFQDGLSVAAHEEMKDGKLMALLSVSKDSQRFVFEVPIDKDGLFHIDPNSTEGKMLFENVNGHAVYNGAFIEIAKQTGIGKDGHELMQILGTHEGTNAPHDITETITKDTTEPHVVFNVPGDTYYNPPFIPIPPVTWRRPLERGVYDKAIIAGGLYDESYLDRDSLYEEPMYLEDNTYEESSEIFASDSANETTEILDPADVERNLSVMSEYMKNNVDLKLMNELDGQINQPMDNNARISVVLPCYHEAKDVYKTLSDWTMAQKDLKPEELEIIAFVNAPKKDEPLDSETISEIERFNKEHPEYKVRLVTHNFDFKTNRKMGEIYKTATDLALFRNMKRLNNAASQEIVSAHLLRSGGADALGRNPRFLREVIDFMKNHPETEQLRTQSAYPPEVREKFPLFNLMTVFNHSLSALYTRGKSNIGLGTYRARAYAEVSGFDPLREYREEIDLGIRIRDKVGKKKNAINKLVKKNAIDNPRRELFALARGDTVLRAYSGFSDSGRDTALRDFDWNKKLPANFEKNIKMNQANMNREFDAYFQHFQGKIEKESGIISKIISGELTSDMKGVSRLHPEARLMLKDPELISLIKQIDTKRASGEKITRSSSEVKKISELATRQMFDRILRTTFRFRKGKTEDYNYTTSSDGQSHITFTKKAVDTALEASKLKWANFSGYWDRPKKVIEEKEEVKKPERKKARTETMSGEDLKTEMLDTFTAILKEKGGQATLDKKKFRIDIEGNSIIGHAELKTPLGLGGSPVIDLDLVSGGEGLVFNTGGNMIKKVDNKDVRAKVNEAIAGVPHQIKATLEKKYNQKIKKIAIKNGELKITFK